MIKKLNRELYFKYLLYDSKGVLKRQLYTVDSGNFNYSSLSRLKKSASISMEDAEDIDFLNDEIQIICVIDGTEKPISRLLLTSPRKNRKTNLRQIECYSRLKLLDDAKLENRTLVANSTNVVNEVKRIIGDKGACNIADSNLTLNADKIFEAGTSELDIINELLATINYHSLTDDENGVFFSAEYVLPSDREIQVVYDDDPETTIIEEDISEEFDLYNAPNVFIRYSNNPDVQPALRAVYENNNPASIISTANRRRIVDVKEVKGAANIGVLNLIAKKDCAESTTKYSNLEFVTAINPVHGFSTCVYINACGISDKFIETSFSIELKSGGSMMHVARKVVYI